MNAHPFLRTQNSTHPELQPTGQVLSVLSENQCCMVSTAKGVLKAQVALSCVLQPLQGDLVLLAETEAGCFIISLLQREQAVAAALHFPHGVSVHSQGGLALKSTGDLSLESASKTEVTSPIFNIAALKSRLRILDVVAQINHFQGRFSKLQWLAEWAEQKAERFRQRFGSSDRVVQHHDLQKAGNLVQQVEHTASLRSEHTIIKAREDVQVDGKRIHMG